MRYIFTVSFCDPTSDFNILAGRCHKVLHGFQTRHEIRSIGVSYNLWGDSTIGSRIAFVSSDSNALEAFLRQDIFKQMSEIKKFACTKISAVEEGGLEARFCRIYSPDKHTKAWYEKENRRREKRGLEPLKVVTSQTKIIGHYHDVPMISVNKKKKETEDKNDAINIFSLHIQRRLVEAPVQDNFSSYGLSGGVNTGTVPVFERMN
ncbi:type I-F CRISPR-associated endoribonuclease Cas6/Csy4 [Endozoicomonas sp. ONNA1]|uniref:type I-F CRISPR-associated endoribonuclease Cas6/Csy4 n=1 Tax=Endozoicomonas sp. ONNA1 TaxID=2828740 RepID=UPI002148363C